MKEIIIDRLNANQKAEKFVKKYLNDAPLSFIYKTFRKKDIKVNGHWIDKGYTLKENDVLRIYVTDQQLEDFNKPKPLIKLAFNHEIIYEDENILVVNKPSGLLVHGDEEEKRLTLSNQVLSYLFSKGEYDPKNTFTPSPAHRLDRNTSGIVFFGKNNDVLQALMQIFKEKDNIQKYYYTLVLGKTDRNGTIDKPLIKDEKNNLVRVDLKSEYAKNAITKYTLINSFKDTSLLSVQILTGRTHQIRVHLASINHPVIGDAKYGNFEKNKEYQKLYGLNHQFLHCYKVKFLNLNNCLSYLSNKEFLCQLPNELDTIIKDLKNINNY